MEEEEISLCKNCMCMTKDIRKSLTSSIIFCGKCGFIKIKEVENYNQNETYQSPKEK